MYRILHTGMTPNYGGVESVIMNWYRNIDRTRFQFDFLIGHDIRNIAYEKEILELGGHIYPNYYGRKEKPFTAFTYISKIFKEDPLIKGVHMNLNTLEYITPLLEAKKRNLPIKIVHSHNSGNLNGKERIETRLMQSINKKILKSSQFTKLGCSINACDFMFGNANYTVLHNAIDIDHYRYDEEKRMNLRKKYHISKETKVVGFVGRIQYQKNPEFAIKVFHNYLKMNQDSLLIMIGSGPLEEKCKALVKKLKLIDKVLFLGMKKDTADYYSMFDILLFPSLFEGLGVVLIEAQVCGLPCLVSNMVPEDVMITPLIEKHNLSDDAFYWSKHMTTLMKKNGRDRRCVDFTENIANAGYDVRSEVKRLEKLYTLMIEGR